MLMPIVILCLPPTAETAVPVHSHNDYWRSRPLQEALEAGCLSIEADVVVRGGTLMVGHGAERSPQNAPSLRCTSHPWPKSFGHDNGCTPRTNAP